MDHENWNIVHVIWNVFMRFNCVFGAWYGH